LGAQWEGAPRDASIPPAAAVQIFATRPA